MAEHDPEAFQHLFEAEPDEPSPGEIAEWVELYTRLVDLLERQLAVAQRFGEAVPEAPRTYLSDENVRILNEELGVFRDRLVHRSTLR